MRRVKRCKNRARNFGCSRLYVRCASKCIVRVWYILYIRYFQCLPSSIFFSFCFSYSPISFMLLLPSASAWLCMCVEQMAHRNTTQNNVSRFCINTFGTWKNIGIIHTGKPKCIYLLSWLCVVLYARIYIYIYMHNTRIYVCMRSSAHCLFERIVSANLRNKRDFDLVNKGMNETV